MKIDPKALLSTSGIGCLRLLRNAETGAIEARPARAAFVTRESAALSRTTSGKVVADVGYGDVLVMVHMPDGSMRGEHAQAGADAGVALEVASASGDSRLIPFTGPSMLTARSMLCELSGSGSVSDDMRRALEGIRGSFELVAAHPDPSRHRLDLVGQAFHAALIDSFGDLELPFSHEAFGRKARADMIRARIASIDPLHPDALGFARDLPGILEAAGVQISWSGGLEAKSDMGFDFSEQGMRRAAAANDGLRRNVFGRATRTPVDRIAMSVIPEDDMESLIDRHLDRRLSGSWIDGLRADLEEALGDDMTGGDIEMEMLSIEGRDLMFVRDDISASRGHVFVYAWPASDRALVSTSGSRRMLNISPEEIPEIDEIRRLVGSLDQIEARSALGEDLFLEASPAQRSARVG
jgi:hypothetical protein